MGANGLANFFLIDHSLKKSGGHHADYTCCVANAAVEMGFKTTIGANVGMAKFRPIDELGEVRRVFRDTTYQRDSYLVGLRQLTRAKFDFLQNEKEGKRLARLARYFSERRHRKRREKFIRNFAFDCYRFFDRSLFSEGDHAFFTTVSELELMGLACFLSNHPRTLQLNWHLQFHYNLFEGRTPEYNHQQNVARALQACFDAALSRVPYHAIHFYTTSETLADQYNRLGVGTFQTLPYPVSPAFGKLFNDPFNDENCESKSIRNLVDVNPAVSDKAAFGKPSKTLRLTCPGGVRREKGHADYLQTLVDDVWDSHLANGQVKIVVQKSSKCKLEIKHPPSKHSPIEYLGHPLAEEDYIEFIKSADAGLLFYDSRVYFGRRAGVFGELLSCGKPVVVPAGSWLADQLQEPASDHAMELLERFGVSRDFDIRDLEFNSRNAPLPGGVASFDQKKNPFLAAFEKSKNEDGIVVQFEWHWPEEAGVFAKVCVVEKDDSGAEVANSSQILGRCRDSGDVAQFFRGSSDATRVEIRFSNAFHDSTASIRNLKISTLNCDSEQVPTGAVGIIAAGKDDLANSIDELVNHYAHYRSSAEAFSKDWSRRHRPSQTIARLMLSEQEAFRAA